MNTAHTLALAWHRANACDCKLSPMVPTDGKAALIITVWRKGAPDVTSELPFEFAHPGGSLEDLETFGQIVLLATKGLPFVELDDE